MSIFSQSKVEVLLCEFLYSVDLLCLFVTKSTCIQASGSLIGVKSYVTVNYWLSSIRFGYD